MRVSLLSDEPEMESSLHYAQLALLVACLEFLWRDRTLKKALYQDCFRTPEYFWFSPETFEFAGFQLVGHTYESIAPTPQGWLWSDELGLYLGVSDHQLRYFAPTGELIPTPAETAIQELQAKQAAEQRANRLAEQLRSLGINPDEV